MPKNAKNLVGQADGAASTLVYFGLGGTGIRSVEPLLHLCALGLGPKKLRLVLIDPDLRNAAVDRIKSLIKFYNEVRDRFAVSHSREVGYFRTEVISAVGHEMVWSPVADDDHLPAMDFGSRVDRTLMDLRGGKLGRMFDFLFAEQYQAMDLGMGFRGVPSIGTVFMNRLREQAFFRRILADAQGSGDTAFFATGSVFGGTGAAALPVVGRALVEGLRAESPRSGEGDRPAIPGVPARRTGAALILPFFMLPAEIGTEAGPRPRAELFAQNAAAALPMYHTGDAKYGSMYVIGESESRQQLVNAVGGPKQDNPSHYVEFYAALAALDFAAAIADESVPTSTFQYIAVGDDHDHEGRDVSWDDLPLSAESTLRLQGGLAAVHTFLKVFRPNGGPDPQLARKLKGVTWMSELGMRPSDLGVQSASFDAVARYFMRIWEWAGDLRASSPAALLARSDRKSPAAGSLADTILCYAPRHRFGDDFEVFREWNLVASACRNYGSGAFLETMRQGSEAFVRSQFAEPEHAVRPVEAI